MQHCNGLVWSTPLSLPGRCGTCMHQQSTSGIRKRKKKKKKTKKVALHISPHGATRGHGLTSLVVCNYDKFHDTRERNVTTKSEIWTTNIRSLGFRDIREWVTLWMLILWSLGCMCLIVVINWNSVLEIHVGWNDGGGVAASSRLDVI